MPSSVFATISWLPFSDLGFPVDEDLPMLDAHLVVEMVLRVSKLFWDVSFFP